jgi:hypothetical protein
LAEPKKSDEEVPASTENIFRIVDKLVYQVDITKKLVVVMLAAVIAAIPISWHVTPFLLGTPYNFRAAGIITILIGIVFFGVGVRQWLALSEWTKKYGMFKQLQKRVDDQLDFEGPKEKGTESKDN